MEYTNANFILLGLVAEQVTGEDIADIIDERILAPLELTETSYPNDNRCPTAPAGYTLRRSCTPSAVRRTSGWMPRSGVPARPAPRAR